MRDDGTRSLVIVSMLAGCSASTASSPTTSEPAPAVPADPPAAGPPRSRWCCGEDAPPPEGLVLPSRGRLREGRQDADGYAWRATIEVDPSDAAVASLSGRLEVPRAFQK